jgi:hypothetical protein
VPVHGKVSKPLKFKAIAEARVYTEKIDAGVLAQLLRCDFLPNYRVSTSKLRQHADRQLWLDMAMSLQLVGSMPAAFLAAPRTTSASEGWM